MATPDHYPPCTVCKLRTNSAESWLLRCADCGLTWHHSPCLRPQMSPGELLQRLKNHNKGRRRHNLDDDWFCRACKTGRVADNPISVDSDDERPPAEVVDLTEDSDEEAVAAVVAPPSTMPTPPLSPPVPTPPRVMQPLVAPEPTTRSTSQAVSQLIVIDDEDEDMKDDDSPAFAPPPPVKSPLPQTVATPQRPGVVSGVSEDFSHLEISSPASKRNSRTPVASTSAASGTGTPTKIPVGSQLPPVTPTRKAPQSQSLSFATPKAPIEEMTIEDSDEDEDEDLPIDPRDENVLEYLDPEPGIGPHHIRHLRIKGNTFLPPTKTPKMRPAVQPQLPPKPQYPRLPQFFKDFPEDLYEQPKIWTPPKPSIPSKIVRKPKKVFRKDPDLVGTEVIYVYKRGTVRVFQSEV